MAPRSTHSLSRARVDALVSAVTATSGDTSELHTPLDGQRIAGIPQSSIDDVDDAFERARTAQQTWSGSNTADRAAILLRLHDLVLDRQAELLDLIQLESGKSRTHAFDEIAHVALTARYYARRLHKLIGRESRLGALPGLTSVWVHRVPKGVVGLISPWNYPLTMAISDGIAAVAAGNAVVHKPDSQTPLTALAGIELLRRAGLPEDVWTVVTGPGAQIGTAIVDRADYVSFTGSTETGAGIARRLSDRLVGSSLELGGKNPMIVLPGADVERAAAGAVDACFSSAGQLCVSVERLYVHDSIYTRFRDAFVRRIRALKIATGLDWRADIGSLVSAAQLEKTMKHVDNALANGASVAVGGNARPDLGPYVYEPTVLENVTTAADCFAEETFGPVVSLYRYSTPAEVITLANAGDYGLNASIWGPTRHAREVAGAITAGTVNINEGFAASFASIDAPMGGMRQSGMGRRQADEGLWRYTESQTVAVQRLMPMAGFGRLTHRGNARILTAGLRLLRRTPRA